MTTPLRDPTDPPPPSTTTSAASTQPTPNPTPTYDPLRHHISFALLLTCPVIMLLPPRKLDFYTFGLATAWVLSANELSVQRSGRGVLERVYGVRNKAVAVGKEGRGDVGKKQQQQQQEEEEQEEEVDIGQRIRERVWEVWNWDRKDKDG